MSENPDSVIGRLVDGRYQVRSLIARGGMATVYVATDLRLDRRVAIKIMHDHLAADAAFRDRFIREARAAARLAHPNLVNVYDQGEDAQLAYIVMEYVPGITLRDLLHEHHRLTVEQTIDIMDAVLAGLQVAHRQGIIHRDVKPENVLLADDGRIKLSDFGLARAVTNATASGSVLLGTIAYLAPELVTQGAADVRSDIYSAGIMMYEMLVGQQPYRGDEPVNIAFRHANDNVPPPSEARPDVPGVLDDLVVWATERTPADRPADAGAMLAALRQAERDITSQSGATSSFQEASARFARRDAPVLTSSDEDLLPTAWQKTGALGSVPPLNPAADVNETAARGAARRLQRLNGYKRRSGAVAAVVVVLLALAAGGFGWYQGIGPGSYDAVPSVLDVSRDQAQQLLDNAGFSLGEVSGQNSLDVPEGTVMNMDPPAGTRLAPGSGIDLVVSAGPRILTVPSLRGLSTADAQQAITAAGFQPVPERDAQEFHEEIPAGHVIRGTTASGAELPQEMAEAEQIYLVVSAGAVPQVTGQSRGDAQANLEQVGLQAAVVAEEFSSTVPKDVVMSQQSTADPMKPGDTVNLVVSRGPDLVEVPQVQGRSVTEAVAALEAAGLKVSHSVPDVLLENAKVSSLTPAAGEQVERGSTVQLRATYEF